MHGFSITERRRLADEHALDERYLYQCLTGRRNMDAARAMELESASNGAIRRWHLRPKDWHRIWPELVGAAGAPPVPADEAVRDVA